MAGKIRELCRYIQAHGDQSLRLADLGRRAGISPWHLQRCFKAVIGVTPRQYVEACRLQSLKTGLRQGPSVAHAVYGAGFGSGSRVYERAAGRLGMTPGQYRKGGEGLEISHAVAQTPLGLLLMAATDRGLCAVQLGDTQSELLEQLGREFPGAVLKPMPRRGTQFARWMRLLDSHLKDTRLPVDLPLEVRGTAFQMKVWNCLLRIPAGETRTYTEVAEAIGLPAAVRAVASACAANRIAVLIPCHRVIRGDGGLGGYRWGLERKRTLLDQELRSQS